MKPEDVPARHDRLAAAMVMHIVDHGLRDAVKWVMEPEMLAMEAEIERQVRERVAAAILAKATALAERSAELEKANDGRAEEALDLRERAGYLMEAVSVARGES